LDLCSRVVEEQAFEAALSKLDYYKAGISCCKRIFEKSNTQNVLSVDIKSVSEQSEDTPKPLKRAKTEH
jgi:hypothetical protein